MAIVRCDQGHYYDNERFSQCPHCGIFTQQGEGNALSKLFKGKQKESKPNQQIKRLTPRADQDDDKTVNLYGGKVSEKLLVGWLVCIDGPEVGRDYPLHQGFNRLGRDPKLEIVIGKDEGISRDPVCSIVYDDRQNQFFLSQQEGGQTYLNETLLAGSPKLQLGDILQLGQSKFEFIPFCREGRDWRQIKEIRGES